MNIAPLIGKQRESVFLANARINLWEGAVRSSKTISSIIAWIKFIREAPPGNLLMFAKTERTLKRNVLDPMGEMLGPKRVKVQLGKGEATILGRTIYLAGANDERAQDKIKGLSLLGAYGDEITTAPESFFAMLLTRLSDDGARLFGTTNPDGPNHWLKRDYLNRASLWLTGPGQLRHNRSDDNLDLHRFSFRIADNPNLSRTYVRSLEREFVGLWRKRYILGEWVLAEGAVYEMWDEARHVVKKFPRIERWISVGVDYGTVNPFVGLLLGLGVDRRLYFTSEYRYDSRAKRRQKTDAEYSKDLRGWLNEAPISETTLRGAQPQWTCVDPSAASFILQLHQDSHPGVTLADNSVLDGIRLMASLFGSDQLAVSEDCPGFIEEAPGYAWDDKASEKGLDEPIKLNDHDMDAGRYAVKTTEQLWRPSLREAA